MGDSRKYQTNIDRKASTVMGNKKQSIDSSLKESAQDLQDVRKNYYETVPLKKSTQKSLYSPLKTTKASERFDRLSSTKRGTEFSNPYLASEFRGLLISDWDEALNNCDTGDYKTLTSFDKKLLGNRLAIGKRKSNATRELFPSPYDLTKYNIDSVKKLRKNRNFKGHNTAAGFFNASTNGHILTNESKE